MQIQTDFSCGFISRGPKPDLRTVRIAQWLNAKEGSLSSQLLRSLSQAIVLVVARVLVLDLLPLPPRAPHTFGPAL
jgi:hypothetical protein